MTQKSRELLLIDGHSLIHRAYHAFPATLSTASGEQTNAVYGFTRMLLEAIHELKPTHVAVAFDLPGPTFRETMFVGYKRSRAKPDDAMIAQIPRVKEVVQTLGIPIFEVPGYEADDVIGTLAKQASQTTDYRLQTTEKSTDYSLPTTGRKAVVGSRLAVDKNNDVSVIILTSDRDLMQLIRGSEVRVKMSERGRRAKGQGPKAKGNSSSPQPSALSPRPSENLWNEERFIEHWGFKPELLPDYKAFAGDQSDDIPGVRGVGEKTAKELVATLGSVEEVYRKVGVDPSQRKKEKGRRKKEVLMESSLQPSSFSLHPSLLKKLAEDQEAAQMSKQLATIDIDVPIKLDWGAMEVHGYDKTRTIELFDELQFKSLIPKLPNDSFEESVQEVLF